MKEDNYPHYHVWSPFFGNRCVQTAIIQRLSRLILTITLFLFSTGILANESDITRDEGEFKERSELNFGVNYVDVIPNGNRDIITKVFSINNNAHSGYVYGILLNGDDVITVDGEKRKIFPSHNGVFIEVKIYLDYPKEGADDHRFIYVEDPGECGTSYVHFYRGESNYLEFKYATKKDYHVYSTSRFIITTYRLSFGENPGFSVYYAPVRSIETKYSYCDAKEAFRAEGDE